jgi:hypothetical protein
MITKDVLMRPKLSDVIVCLEKETPLEWIRYTYTYRYCYSQTQKTTHNTGT